MINEYKDPVFIEIPAECSYSIYSFCNSGEPYVRTKVHMGGDPEWIFKGPTTPPLGPQPMQLTDGSGDVISGATRGPTEVAAEFEFYDASTEKWNPFTIAGRLYQYSGSRAEGAPVGIWVFAGTQVWCYDICFYVSIGPLNQ